MNLIKCLKPKSYKVGDGISASLTWVVRTDADHDPASVRKVDGFPAPGDKCPFDSRIEARSISVEMVDCRTFLASVEYSSAGAGSNTPNYGNKPWNKPPKISYSTEKRMEVVELGYAGDESSKPDARITNSAGDPYDTPPQLPVNCRRIRIEWNARSFDESKFAYFWGTINRDNIVIDGKTYAKKQLLLEDILPQPVTDDDGTNYVSVSADILYHPKGHNFKPLELGWKARDRADGKIKKVYIDSSGTFVFDPGTDGKTKLITEPVLLNQTGYLIASTQDAMNKAKAVYGDHRYLALATWRSLAIPSIRGVRRKMGDS